ncbi:MAG: GNAT family N-acetyltransferase [Gemmatimonas sp.]
MIRIATREDITQLVDIINRAYVAEEPIVHGRRADRLDLNERLSQPNTWMLVREEVRNGAREIIGCVCLDCNGQRGHIGLLSVDPDYQGRGLGAELLRAAERECEQRMGCADIELDVVSVRDELFPFYERMGYERVDRIPFPQPDRLKVPADLVVMRKKKTV